MVNDARKHQKKLERRAAQRKEKRQTLVRRQSVGLADQLRAATQFPVLDCWIADSLDEQGIGHAGLSRRLANGSVAIATFLVDRFCLGVKDAFAEVVSRFEYESKYRTRFGTVLSTRGVAPADVCKLVENAVVYANGFRIFPHEDYAKAAILFGSIDATQSQVNFEFGKDGQPFFIPGPNDSPARCRQIIALLNKACGPDQANFLVAASGADLGLMLPEEPADDSRVRGFPSLAAPDDWTELEDDEQ